MPTQIVSTSITLDDLRLMAEQHNVRPSQGNRSRGVESPAVQEQIREAVERLIIR